MTKAGDHIITLRCLTFRGASVGEPGEWYLRPDQFGEDVVAFASWSESRGEGVISMLETWKCIQPNMWLVTPRRK